MPFLEFRFRWDTTFSTTVTYQPLYDFASITTAAKLYPISDYNFLYSIKDFPEEVEQQFNLPLEL